MHNVHLIPVKPNLPDLLDKEHVNSKLSEINKFWYL